MNVSGTDYELIGYDEYLKDFEELVLPEFKGDAESMLQRKLEEQPRDGESIEIYLEEEKTKAREARIFPFCCQLSDVGLEVSYEHYM